MAIATDDAIWKFGTQDAVHSGTPATIASNAYGKADQGATINWTNDDDAMFGSAVFIGQFATMPTVGSLSLYARVLNVQGTNDQPEPDADYPHVLCGTFPIDFGATAATNFVSTIPEFRVPQVVAGQAIDWYIRNDGTGQTLSASWQLYIAPKSPGPHA